MADEPGGTWARQLRTGLLDLAILRHLADGPVHGYALISALKRQGLMAPDGGEATVYQALQRLARLDLAAFEWSRPRDGDERPRKLYTLTRRGRQALGQMAKDWHAVRDALDQLLETPA